MDLTLPLTDLVTKVAGAFGAILVDADGEAVTIFALPDQVGLDCCVGDERIKLIGAYQIITLRACSHLARQFKIGEVQHLVCRYGAAAVLIKALKNNYALVLVMQDSGNIGQGAVYLDQAAEVINQDL